MFGPRLALGALAVIAMVAAGCGKKDDDKKSEGPAKPAVTKATPDNQPPAAAFDHDAFCAAVFAPDDVGAVLGVEGLVAVPPRTAIAAKTADCNVEKRGDKGIEVSAKLRVDCRAMASDVKTHKQMQEGMAEKGTYRDVELGKGGGYAKTLVANFTVHSVIFVHASTPCSLDVSHVHLDENKADALAKAIDALFNDSNRPR